MGQHQRVELAALVQAWSGRQGCGEAGRVKPARLASRQQAASAALLHRFMQAAGRV